MKRTLVYRAYYVIEMPDINETSPVYQDLLANKTKQALSETSDNWIMNLQDILDWDITEYLNELD